MRVALVIERFEDAAGGGEQVAWNVARELVAAGDEVHVFCREGDAAPGVELHRLQTPRFWQPIRVVSFARRAGRALARHDFDVVHAFSKAHGSDVLHVGGGSHADYMEQTYGTHGARWRRLSPRHRTLLALEKQVFRSPHLIGQCVSHRVQREIASRHPVDEARLPVIPCGVDIARFAAENQGAARGELRREFAIGEEVPVWLFVGSGWRRKGLDLAIDALALVDDARSELWVAGREAPGRWRKRIEERGLSGRVRFLGARSDMERVYAACDGVVFPSRYDAFGLVCLEAAAAERPVVVSERAGASELFEACGHVVHQSEDAPSYAAAMNELADPEHRQEMVTRARRMAEEHDWPAHTAKLRSLYERVRSRDAGSAAQ